MTARTSGELRSHWDAFAPLFQERFEPATLQLAHSLVLNLRLAEARRVLEVGGGAGGAARLARGALAPGARLVTTDLAPAMARLARRALEPDVHVAVADAEALPFPGATFDRLLANLSLMLVPDPDRALAEARRVLRPGGLAAWSVWGRPAHSPLFTIPPAAAERAGVEVPPPPRSNFHLGDREALRVRVSAAGFDGVLAWYQPMVVPTPDGATFAERVLATPGWQPLVADLSPERRAALEAAMAHLADETLGAGRPIALEALVVVARAA